MIIFVIKAFTFNKNIYMFLFTNLAASQNPPHLGKIFIFSIIFILLLFLQSISVQSLPISHNKAENNPSLTPSDTKKLPKMCWMLRITENTHCCLNVCQVSSVSHYKRLSKVYQIRSLTGKATLETGYCLKMTPRCPPYLICLAWQEEMARTRANTSKLIWLPCGHLLGIMDTLV